MNISPHISYEEATHTNTGLPNIPDVVALKNMQELAIKVIEPVRAFIKKPIRVNSFYRSPAVNKKVGGSPTSQHVTGEAVDIDVGLDNAKVFNYIATQLDFDQAIWEHGTQCNPAWVHVSYRKGKNRKQKLCAIKQNGKTVYIPI